MDRRWIRASGWVLVWVVGCVIWWWSGQPIATASSDNWTIPPAPPQLSNPGFECGAGYTAHLNPLGREVLVPNGWTPIFILGSPDVSSTRRFYTGECNESSPRFIERLQGIDSLLVRSQDIETLPEPGKPFDVVLYHRVPATYGGAYSLSTWMASKCGNTNPVDCPDGYYIIKAVGIDPNGGTDPHSAAIEWVESRENLHWQNLYTSATALTDYITIFARMTSPFQFHGNLGFMDEFSLVRAPLSALDQLPERVEGAREIELGWRGLQSPDVEQIGGTYELLFDVQARPLPDGAWRNVVVGATAQMTTAFRAPCSDMRYEFRVRARAEQPPAPPEGVFPNHRYPGVWSKPQSILFSASPTVPITPTQPITVTEVTTPSLYLPLAGSSKVC